MREILFRGQTRRKGEKVDMGGKPLPSNWVYGGVFHQNDRGGSFSIIYSYDPIEKYPVYADTVGQYTGLTDKNGEKIFEGDILSYTNEDGEKNLITVVFDECAFLIDDSGIVDSDLLTSCICLGIEVVGNIYDNSELLKVSKEG